MSKEHMPKLDLSYLQLKTENALYQLCVPRLIEEAILNAEGFLTDSGALAIDTGEFTGRSPKDRFIVTDAVTENKVWWGDINIPYSADKFNQLFAKMIEYLNQNRFYVRDAYVGSDSNHQTSLRVITETAYQSLFVNNLFLRSESEEEFSIPQWTIIAAPSFKANPQIDDTRQENFSIINFSRKVILIGGTGYTGEIKKAVFSVLNFTLPSHNVLPMHCSANIGRAGDTAIFFGLSGTGKTTLSADPERRLIGDDEHGWHENAVFNFEGGCYAKCADLSAEKEPEIFHAVRFGSLLENVKCFSNTRTVNFSDISKTENTRVAYPIDFINNAVIPSVGSAPENIFFLTADAFGILPPISKLSSSQAMFHFMSGYTAKIAGTEAGVTEPQATFSACFGKAFLPLHPAEYANLLGKKLSDSSVNIWLVNTGWSGGAYGTGKRIKLSYTRAMINAALSGALNKVLYELDPYFGLKIPLRCPGVPDSLLNPRNSWPNTQSYDLKAKELRNAFMENFKQFEEHAASDILDALPKLVENTV
ncbi:phosphoenolpyruvate carboxykinase (ATP) [Pedobacter deserti]|uniref:phosphoenolpyruvate carboxykinase (ATP) n=1 Tax=Pedobacter deserti TaxID=2817382 RepID=UPI00210B7804|nr:phosphoenolpyruvate carboxykinase (ATP) [Pedobacter sp. SYSU D00382]